MYYDPFFYESFLSPYKIGFETPKNLKRIENKVDTLNLNIKEIQHKLIQIQDVLEEKK